MIKEKKYFISPAYITGLVLGSAGYNLLHVHQATNAALKFQASAEFLAQLALVGTMYALSQPAQKLIDGYKYFADKPFNSAAWQLQNQIDDVRGTRWQSRQQCDAAVLKAIDVKNAYNGHKKNYVARKTKFLAAPVVAVGMIFAGMQADSGMRHFVGAPFAKAHNFTDNFDLVTLALENQPSCTRNCSHPKPKLLVAGQPK